MSTKSKLVECPRTRVERALRYLRSDHVQKNTWRLGVLGLQDLNDATAELEKALQQMTQHTHSHEQPDHH